MTVTKFGMSTMRPKGVEHDVSAEAFSLVCMDVCRMVGAEWNVYRESTPTSSIGCGMIEEAHLTRSMMSIVQLP